jgi:hypothetical protein
MTSFSDTLLTAMMTQQEIQIKGDYLSGLWRQGNGYDSYTQVISPTNCTITTVALQFTT